VVVRVGVRERRENDKFEHLQQHHHYSTWNGEKKRKGMFFFLGKAGLVECHTRGTRNRKHITQVLIISTSLPTRKKNRF
jgi:hypothetical protein